ncbi:MAG: HPr family phosphocarrier protein [Desulfobacteraceae bacterium]|nr:HPr family phosphocarrier protein [Desulfobacteraceae bacterium]
MKEKIKKKESLSHNITIKNLLGIHARPAAKIAEIVKKAKQNVWLSTQDSKVDAGSIIDILSLGGCMGTKILVEIETHEDIDILKMICDLFESRFGEEEIEK